MRVLIRRAVWESSALEVTLSMKSQLEGPLEREDIWDKPRGSGC